VFTTQAAGGHLLAATLSANFKIEGSLTIIPEVWLEQAYSDLYLQSPGQPSRCDARRKAWSFFLSAFRSGFRNAAPIT